MLLRLEGRTIAQISETLHRTPKTVGDYLHKYQDGVLKNLEMDHSPGKPPKLSKEQTQQLTDLLAHKRPVDVGFEAKYTWTLKLTIHYIEREYGHTFSERGLSFILTFARLFLLLLGIGFRMGARKIMGLPRILS